MPFSAHVHVFQNSPTFTPLSRSPSPCTTPFELHSENTSSALTIRDLELLHHYSTVTSLTLSELQPAQRAWQRAIPQLAFSHAFVGHGLLAMASVHLARLREHSVDKELFLNRAASQLNAGIVLFRDAIQQITRQNCDALFALSTFISVFIFATARDECGLLLASTKIRYDETSPDAGVIRVVVRLLRTLRGALVVLQPAWDWIAKGPMSPICTREEWPKHPMPANVRAIEEDKSLAALSSLWEKQEEFGNYSEILFDALHQLRIAFARVSQLTLATTVPTDSDEDSGGLILTDRGAAFTWPFHVSEKYIVLLEQQRPQALVLLAHFAILLNRVQDCWWIEDIAPHIVTSVALILGTERRSWISWPIRAVQPKNIAVV